jgi:anti-sigma B factor antagonist
VLIVTDATEEFGVDVTGASEDVTIIVTGELDLATCPQLADALDGVVDGRHGSVAVDLSGVTFLDSTALTVLITFRQRLQSLGRRLVLDQPSPVVVRVLTISGLLETFSVPSPD